MPVVVKNRQTGVEYTLSQEDYDKIKSNPLMGAYFVVRHEPDTKIEDLPEVQAINKEPETPAEPPAPETNQEPAPEPEEKTGKGSRKPKG